MPSRAWPPEGEPIKAFADAVETIRAVIGEPVVLRISEDDRKSPVEVRGVLAEAPGSDRDLARFQIGESAHLIVSAPLFDAARRSAVDGGDYWAIAIKQGRLTIRLT